MIYVKKSVYFQCVLTLWMVATKSRMAAARWKRMMKAKMNNMTALLSNFYLLFVTCRSNWLNTLQAVSPRCLFLPLADCQFWWNHFCMFMLAVRQAGLQTDSEEWIKVAHMKRTCWKQHECNSWVNLKKRNDFLDHHHHAWSRAISIFGDVKIQLVSMHKTETDVQENVLYVVVHESLLR